jgi:hypothetical protein
MIVVSSGDRPLLSTDDRKQYYEDEFMELFGVGEFPFLHLNIVRIGNHDYYFYTITR